MDIVGALNRRKSNRAFQPAPVPKEILKRTFCNISKNNLYYLMLLSEELCFLEPALNTAQFPICYNGGHNEAGQNEASR